jgi:hypothetical protein
LASFFSLIAKKYDLYLDYEESQKKVYFENQFGGDPKPKKRVTIANFKKYEEDSEEDEQQTNEIFEEKEQSFHKTLFSFTFFIHFKQ